MNWSELSRLVFEGFATQGRLQASSPQRFSFSGNGNRYVYFLAPTRGKTSSVIHKIDCDEISGHLASTSKVMNMVQKSKDAQIFSKEEELQRERQRVTSVGITSYEYDSQSGHFLFTTAGQLYRCHEENDSAVPELVPHSVTGAPLCPTFSPISSDIIAFVRNKDLWIVSMKSGEEHQLTEQHSNFTSDIVIDSRSAGVPSFIIQEEFDRHIGYWWQPHQTVPGKYCILVEMTDEKNVDIIRTLDPSDICSECECHRYPRSGRPNAVQSVALVEFELDEMHQISNLATKYLNFDLKSVFPWMEYIVRCGWLPDSASVWLQLLDRNQQRLQVVRISLSCFNSDVEIAHSHGHRIPGIQLLKEETSDVWINVTDILSFLTETSIGSEDNFCCSFVWASEATGYRHLQKISVGDFCLPCDGNGNVETPRSRQESWLTSGEWEVDDSSVWVDEARSLVFFQGTRDSPLEQHLYVASLVPGSHIECLTAIGHNHSVTMSEDCCRFVTLHSSLSDFPAIDVVQIDAPVGGTLPTVACCKNIHTHKLPEELGYWKQPPESFSFTTTDGCLLYGLMFKPERINAGEKYPVIQYVYGGPHAQLVTNVFPTARFALLNLLTKLGYVCIAIDGRGSARRGLQFEGHIKYRMGTVEFRDQIEGLQYASTKYDFMDMRRVGLLGWSYGGYMALIGMAQHHDVFQVAVAGAPVTHWETYDTGYTERYMGTPQQNPEGYKAGSVLQMVKMFPNEYNRLLIVHGLIDENVLFRHTSALVDALNRSLKPYTLQVYPNERHGIRKNTAHYWATILSFLEKNLKYRYSTASSS